jgi:hypothetical protein
MTEAEWLGSPDLPALLDHLSRHATERKARLLACALCRRHWTWMVDERSREVVEITERCAEGSASQEELHAAYADAVIAAEDVEGARGLDSEQAAAGWAALAVAGPNVAEVEDLLSSARKEERAESRAIHVALFHCVFGNPFRLFTLDPTLMTPTVKTLAQAAYDERTLPGGELDPVRLSVLADAVEEAGAGGEVVEHLRGKGPHVRGCWVVDHLLEK